jgi:methylated-DNA-[protein]-cysteine S-methyltransferase
MRYSSSYTSKFDSITIVWEEYSEKPMVIRIFLSDPSKKSDEKALDVFHQIETKSSPFIEQLAKEIQNFLEGTDIKFTLNCIDFNQCYELQKKVLLAEHAIPRGWVSTYKKLAMLIGIPNGARAAGNALAKNPFPILIPCHRAIRSDSSLGGFQGGIKMKKALLELEGIKISEKGKVETSKWYY